MIDPETSPEDTGQASYGNSGEAEGGDPDPNGTHQTDTGIGKQDDED